MEGSGQGPENTSQSPVAVAPKVEISPELEAYKAAEIRRKLEKAIVDKGLIVPAKSTYTFPEGKTTYDGKTSITRDTYEVPDAVQQGLKREVYPKMYGISMVQTREAGNGTEVEIRFTDPMNLMGVKGAEPTLIMSVGKPQVGNDHEQMLRVIDHSNRSDVSYGFRNEEEHPSHLYRGNFQKIEPQLDRMLDTINKLPNEFKPPSVFGRIASGAAGMIGRKAK